jgi:hypothetical protein
MGKPKITECVCEACQGACTLKPGWFHPNQIAPLAKKLGLSEQEFFDKHLLVDWWDNWGDDLEDVFVLSPRIVGESGGRMYPGEPEGVCHWYKGGRCQIHQLGKPLECAFANHTDTHEQHKRKRMRIVRAWLPHQGKIAKLLGREPKAGSYSGGFASIFGNLFS